MHNDGLSDNHLYSGMPKELNDAQEAEACKADDALDIIDLLPIGIAELIKLKADHIRAKGVHLRVTDIQIKEAQAWVQDIIRDLFHKDILHLESITGPRLVNVGGHGTDIGGNHA